MLGNLDGFFERFFKKSFFDMDLNKLEEQIKSQFADKITKVEYVEDGVKYTKEEYRNNDGLIWSVTRVQENQDEEYNTLKAELQKAINEQNFEEAAKLRDKIKEKFNKI
jgi:protein-arginine kinase activator protein McsA